MLASEAKTLSRLNTLFRHLRFKTTQWPHLKRVVRRTETIQQHRLAIKQRVKEKVKALFLATRSNTCVHVVDTEMTSFGTTLHPGQHIFGRLFTSAWKWPGFFETRHYKSYYINPHYNPKSLDSLSVVPEMSIYKE